MPGHKLELSYFLLGCKTSEMQFFLEKNMCSLPVYCESCEVPKVLHRNHEEIIGLVEKLLLHTKRTGEKNTDYEKLFIQNLDISFEEISREYESPSRQKQLKIWDTIDPDFGYEYNKHILSKFNSIEPYGELIRKNVKMLSTHEPSVCQELFNIGETLQGVMYPTFGGKAVLNNREYPSLRCYQRELNSQLEPMVDKIVSWSSLFKKEDLLVSGSNEDKCKDSVIEIISKIKSLLKCPIGGYLNVLLFDSDRKISRNGNSISLSESYYRFFKTIFNREDSYVSTRVLEESLNRNREYKDRSAAVYSRVLRINKSIGEEGLGLIIQNKAGYGYTVRVIEGV